MAFDDPLFWTAPLKIIGVNAVLSGDNAVVIALAARSLPERQRKRAIFWGAGAAAGGRFALLVIGFAISIPLVVFGATLLVKVMDRYPVIVVIGAALIGFVAGEMAWEDAVLATWTGTYPPDMKYLPAIVCAALVVAWGRWLARRHEARHAIQQGEAASG